jgi:DNA-binding CsgD family transcriptional regulator
MTEPAVGSLAGSLRVAIATRGEERIAALTRLLRSLGHEVVDTDDDPDVVLALLPESAADAEIDTALRAVALGLVARAPAARPSGFNAVQEAEARALLTPREAQILDAIADGLTNKAIARRLGISLHTVKFHVESVFRKVGASTRTEAVAKASERRREETIDL